MMSKLTAEEALELMFSNSPAGLEDLDSGGEQEIAEDPNFPFPGSTNSDNSDSESGESEVSDGDLSGGKNKYTYIYITLLQKVTQSLFSGEGGAKSGGRGIGRGRGHSRGRGRGSRSRGGQRGKSRGGRSGGGRQKNFTPSTIPWMAIAANADTAPAPLAFTERTGSTVQLSTNAKPTDYLAIFLDEEVLGLIVDETNGYVPIGTSKDNK